MFDHAHITDNDSNIGAMHLLTLNDLDALLSL